MKRLILHFLLGFMILMALRDVGTEHFNLPPNYMVAHAEPLIQGEGDAEPKEFPHQVALLVEDAPGHTELLCSGAVIHTHFVLAAAHCFDGLLPKTKILVEAGEALNPQIRRVSRIIVHPEYTPFTHFDQWDVALVQLRVPLVLNDAVREIKLGCEAPRGNATYSYWVDANTAAHHGRMRDAPKGAARRTEGSRELVNASVPLLDAAECQAQLDWLDLPLQPVPLCSRPPLLHASRVAHAAHHTLSSGLSGAFRNDFGGLLIQETAKGEKIIIGFKHELEFEFEFEFEFYNPISSLRNWIIEKISLVRYKI